MIKAWLRYLCMASVVVASVATAAQTASPSDRGSIDMGAGAMADMAMEPCQCGGCDIDGDAVGCCMTICGVVATVFNRLALPDMPAGDFVLNEGELLCTVWSIRRFRISS